MTFCFCLTLLFLSGEDSVSYTARTIVYDLGKNLVILIDSAVIDYQDIELCSDSAYYYIDRNQLEAFGACRLRQKEDSIRGKYLRYNIENRKALMKTGRTQIEKGWLSAKEIYWVSKDVVNAYLGRYTTCSDSPPHYYFYSPKMKVFLGDMVIARPIFLYVYDLPIVAAPFWFIPIGSKRKSGLLPFRAGNSKDFGKFIRGFAYYFVLSEYADMTLQVDAMERKGIMPHFELIWDYNPFTKGTIHTSYIKEIDTKHERYSIEARETSDYFLLGSNLNFDINYANDRSFHQDYAETTALWLEREATSSATINKEIGGIKNTITLERRENFIDTTISEKLPYYTLTTPSQTFMSLITYSWAGHINRLHQSAPGEVSDAAGGNIHTSPTTQKNVLNLFTLSPRVDLDLAVFDEDTAGNRLPYRTGYSFTTTANTALFRIFDVDLLGIHGILHKVLPNISYIYTPDFDFGRFPQVAGIPSYSSSNRLNFGLDQEIEAKIGEKKEKKLLARLSLGSGFNLLTDSLSQIAVLLTLPYNPLPRPITGFSLQGNGNINPYTREYNYGILNTILVNTDFLSLNLNQSYSKGGNYQIWFGGDIKPSKNWKVGYNCRYDWENKKFVDYSFHLKRDLHCWEGVFNFNQLGDEWRYDFEVRIKEIPEVKIGKGLLGYVLE